jgi:hypothetical protein
MSHIFTLISGIFVGIYLDQKYKLPEITKYINNIQETLKRNEKK